MSEDQIVQLDPAKVLADDNSRFSLRPLSVQSLMDSILEMGGVMEPVEVSPMSKNKEGFTHRLTFGFNRHAAVSRLNTEQNAGLTLPAIVRESEEGSARIKRQVAENNARETLSPMDKASSIKRLIDTGVEKPEIRRIFASAGGRKGNTVAPMSNAMLNIHLNLLQLPKSIQEDIHSGLVGVEAAYHLGNVPADKRSAVLDRAKADRLKQIEAEEKDEQKFLAAESKVTDALSKVEQIEKTIEEAKVEVDDAQKLAVEKIAAMKAVKVEIAGRDTPAGKEEVEAIKAAEADVKAAQKLKKDASAKLAKAIEEKHKLTETAEEVKAKLEASRNLKKKGKATKAIGKGEIKKAAEAEGTKAGYVPLTISEIRQAVKDLMKDGTPAKVAQIGMALKNCLDGKTTPKMLVEDLAVITGEGKVRETPKKK